jgi:nicotinamide-nucleotide amidase
LAAAKACNLTFATAESCTAGAEVAQAMARGILTRCSADLAVAITGVVGPEPDEDGNPVGLIYCACARRGREPHSVCLHSLQSEREAILEDGICAALGLLLAECSDQHTPPTGQKTPEWEDS